MTGGKWEERPLPFGVRPAEALLLVDHGDGQAVPDVAEGPFLTASWTEAEGGKPLRIPRCRDER